MSASGSAVVPEDRLQKVEFVAKATSYGRVQAHGPAGSGHLRQLPIPLFRPEQAASHMRSVGSSSLARSAEALSPACRT